MSVLENLKPERVFHYFEEITKIPHGSGNTQQISDYLVAFAKEHGLRHVQDESGNVIIFKEAAPGYENAPGISSRTPLKWLGSPTTGKTWPLPPVSGAWPWAGRKLPWKAGRRCLRQSAGYLIPNCRFCSDRNANRFFPAGQMSHVPYWRRFFCLSML